MWWLLDEGLVLGGVKGWWVVVMVVWCEGGWVDGGGTGGQFVVCPFFSFTNEDEHDFMHGESLGDFLILFEP